MFLEERKNLLFLTALAVLFIPALVGLKFFSSGKTTQLFPKEKKAQGERIVSPVSPFSAIQNKPSVVKGPATVLFGGDIMFDRYIRQVIEQKGFEYVWGDVGEVLSGVDLAVANLEGPITDNLSKSAGSRLGSRENYIFTFPPTTATELFEANLRLVNLGNNHLLNFGPAGLAQTKQFLTTAGVEYFGDPSQAEDGQIIKEINGLKIGFVSQDAFIENGSARALSGVAQLRDKTDFVVVYAHWGNEYETRSNQKQQELARKLIQAGADLVIGSHPHVIQEREEFEGKRIYYSLGNFIFDQYFQAETQKGLLVKVIFEKDRPLRFEEKEILLTNDGRTNMVKK